MSTFDNSGSSPGSVDHSQCDPASKEVRCEWCGRTFVGTRWDERCCAAEGDHCCEVCLLAWHPRPLTFATGTPTCRGPVRPASRTRHGVACDDRPQPW
jgi:hypothetical protein